MVKLDNEMGTLMTDAELKEKYWRREFSRHWTECLRIQQQGCPTCVYLSGRLNRAVEMILQERRAIAGTRS